MGVCVCICVCISLFSLFGKAREIMILGEQSTVVVRIVYVYGPLFLSSCKTACWRNNRNFSCFGSVVQYHPSAVVLDFA